MSFMSYGTFIKEDFGRSGNRLIKEKGENSNNFNSTTMTLNSFAPNIVSSYSSETNLCDSSFAFEFLSPNISFCASVNLWNGIRYGYK